MAVVTSDRLISIVEAKWSFNAGLHIKDAYGVSISLWWFKMGGLLRYVVVWAGITLFYGLFYEQNVY